ncbi:MAG: hypothetical protein P0S96_04560 [Simkaniaceae bacterium]|nr:hypothetical protein [Candidatus Sacchlamyda saccharinae]
MKRLFKLLLIPLVFFGLERATRTQTNGFRLEKTQSDFPYQKQWEIPASTPPLDKLKQTFSFLGSGVQCYAFLGEDQETVLKVFKHYHFGLNTKTLSKLPLTQKTLAKRKKRIDTIFKSAILAQTTLTKQTGVIHLNINPARETYPTVTIYDKINIAHQLDLNKTPFLLQKKADMLLPYIATHPEQKEAIMDSYNACVENRTKLQITNTDPILDRNFGVLDGQVIEIDIGSFEEIK